jgi:hypothetical protein
MSTWHRRSLVAAALALNTAMLAWSAARHSPTLNEPDHLASGLIEWRTGSTAYYRVNTPLVRLLAARSSCRAARWDCSRWPQG